MAVDRTQRLTKSDLWDRLDEAADIMSDLSAELGAMRITLNKRDREIQRLWRVVERFCDSPYS